MVRPDLFSEGQVKFNLVSTTAMSHHIRKQEVFPLHTGPNVSIRAGQEGLWPSEGDQTFADACYHTYWLVLIVSYLIHTCEEGSKEHTDGPWTVKLMPASGLCKPALG